MNKISRSIPLLLILILSASCSVSNANKETANIDPNDQFFADAVGEAAQTQEFGAPVTEIAETADQTPAVEPAIEPVVQPEITKAAEESYMPPMVEEQKPQEEVAVQVQAPIIHEEPAFEMSPAQKTEVASYIVKRGDTWMIISQKLLGDPLKWREIQKWNKQFHKSTELKTGATLTYMPPAEPVVQPDGLPYLIKRSDTLPKISYNVYGTRSTWDVIYYNNRQSIKNPDVIYSGFVLYYPEKEQVQVVKAQMAAVHFDVNSMRKPASAKKPVIK